MMKNILMKMNQENGNSKEEKLRELMGDVWYDILKDEFSKDYMSNLVTFIQDQIKAGRKVYPPRGEVFSALYLTPYDKVKVCILGQDPYCNVFEAHGVAFSTYNGQYTPSLKKIEEAVMKDMLYNEEYTWNNNLTRWCHQGVLLLNRVLTVNEGNPNSHKGKGWENFTMRIILELDKKPGMIFLLWGKDAQLVKSYIRNGIIIECEHPAAAHHNKRDWENNDCFKKTNKLLIDKIDW
jgi:uracil-DNA glycosylase